MKYMRRNIYSKSEGFTLVEAILGIGVVGILGIGVAVVMYLYFIFSKNLPQESLRQEVLSYHQKTLEIIKNTVREAGEIESGYSDGVNNYITGSSTVVLKARSRAQNGSLLPGGFDRFILDLDGSSPPYMLKLIVIPSSGSARANSKILINPLVENFYISYNSATPTSATNLEFYLETKKETSNLSFSATSTLNVTLH
jgi:type II secretory pathway pseudopilin PulG